MTEEKERQTQEQESGGDQHDELSGDEVAAGERDGEDAESEAIESEQGE